MQEELHHVQEQFTQECEVHSTLESPINVTGYLRRLKKKNHRCGESI
jgi:hypothetical protein